MLVNSSAHVDALIRSEKEPPPLLAQKWYAPCWMCSAHWPADNPHQYHQSPGASDRPALHSRTKRAASSSLSVPPWNRLWANWWGWAGYAGWYLPLVWDPLFWSSFISKVCFNQVGSRCSFSRVCECVLMNCILPGSLLARRHIDLFWLYSNALDK